MKEKILPLFSILDNLSQDEIVGMYAVLEEAIVTHQETEKLTEKLKHIYNDFNNAIQDVSRKLAEIKERLDYLKRPSNKYLKDNSKPKLGNAMGYNKQSFPGEKPNFGLKLNKLFSSYITEYGPEYITMVISDSILYTNNLILRICLKTRDVLIGSSKSLKLYETKSGSFLITDKPEVIPYGNSAGFHFKYITYEDILILQTGTSTRYSQRILYIAIKNTRSYCRKN
jgi:hypothetical protein